MSNCKHLWGSSSPTTRRFQVILNIELCLFFFINNKLLLLIVHMHWTKHIIRTSGDIFIDRVNILSRGWSLCEVCRRRNIFSLSFSNFFLQTNLCHHLFQVTTASGDPHASCWEILRLQGNQFYLTNAVPYARSELKNQKVEW